MTVPSPCTGVCTLHPATGWCEGCGRTGTEIAAWPSATDAQKRAVLAALPGRQASPAAVHERPATTCGTS